MDIKLKICENLIREGNRSWEMSFHIMRVRTNDLINSAGCQYKDVQIYKGLPWKLMLRYTVLPIPISG